MPVKARVLDFSKVKDRQFNIKHLPEGDYKAKVLSVDPAKSKAGNTQWVFTIGVVEGRGRGATYPYYCVLNDDNVWKARNLLMACGLNVPKKKLNVDPNKAVGKIIGITLEDDEYQGKMKSVITATIPASDISATADDEDEEDGDEELTEEEEVKPAKKKNKAEPKPKAKAKKKKAKPAVDDDELEELEVEEL